MTDQLFEDIKNQIAKNNFGAAIENLINAFEKHQDVCSRDVKSLKNEVNNLKEKLKNLEKINKALVKQNNLHLVKEYSARLVELIENNQYQDFKKLIREHNYPVDEFITEDYKDLSHMNLLHYCIDYNKDKFARFLVTHGANVNAPDKEDKWTPLMYAIQKQNLKMAKFLLEKGASVDYKDEDGFTPLSVAVDSNNREFVSLILKYKPQIDVRLSTLFLYFLIFLFF